MDKETKHHNLEDKHRWNLTDKQYIEISNRNRVAFRCQSNNPRAYRGISLTPIAFECLCKYIESGNQNSKNPICLDKNVWVKRICNEIFLSSQVYSYGAMGQFFRFKPNMWKQYVDEYHDNVHKALKEILYKKVILNDKKKRIGGLKTNKAHS